MKTPCRAKRASSTTCSFGDRQSKSRLSPSMSQRSLHHPCLPYQTCPLHSDEPLSRLWFPQPRSRWWTQGSMSPRSKCRTLMQSFGGARWLFPNLRSSNGSTHWFANAGSGDSKSVMNDRMLTHARAALDTHDALKLIGQLPQVLNEGLAAGIAEASRGRTGKHSARCRWISCTH